MKPVSVKALDHLVLTVASIDDTVQFYQDVLGMYKISFGDGRVALGFGNQKINLHQRGSELKPGALNVGTGTSDLCLIINENMDGLMQTLKITGIEVVEGPVARTGALGEIISIYIRDPDGNLLELSNYP